MAAVSFSIKKSEMKKAISLAKKVFSDGKKSKTKTGKTILVGKGKELLLFASGPHLDLFQYIPLPETQKEIEAFAIRINTSAVEKWLSGKGEAVFVIKAENGVTTFSCGEKKEEVETLEHAEKCFLDLRRAPFSEFRNEKIMDIWDEATKMASVCHERDETFNYLNYLHMTDNNLVVYNPILFAAFFQNENLGISKKFGIKGIAVSKNAIGTLVSVVKDLKISDEKLKHYLMNEQLLIYAKSENKIFRIKLHTDIRFPRLNEIEAVKKQEFKTNATEVNQALKEILKEKGINKIRFQFKDKLYITTDSENAKSIAVSYESETEIPDSSFRADAVSAFFTELNGPVTIQYTIYNSTTTKLGYYWKFFDHSKAKIITGIKEAPGFRK